MTSSGVKINNRSFHFASRCL